MTGYARVTEQAAVGPLTISIRSVNRRTLDVSCHLPPFLAPYEVKIGRWLADKVGRGHLHVHIHWPLSRTLVPNLGLLKELREAAEAVQQEIGLPFSEAFALVCRGREGEIVSAEEIPIPEDELKEAVLKAADALIEMRAEEGAAIARDLLERCEALTQLTDLTEERAKGTAQRVRARLTERLKEWELDEERMVKEVALYAERADTTEELVRFRHHLASLKDKLASKEQGQGKVCEFILQEMAREANTLGAKVQDPEAGETVVKMKGEMEKIREQLANVE